MGEHKDELWADIFHTLSQCSTKHTPLWTSLSGHAQSMSRGGAPSVEPYYFLVSPSAGPSSLSRPSLLDHTKHVPQWASTGGSSPHVSPAKCTVGCTRSIYQ